MKQDVYEKWTSALLGGAYEQGNGSLRPLIGPGGNTWCCLGVLSDLAVKSGEVPGLEWSELCQCCLTNTKGDSEAGMPLQEVYDWAGLEEGQVHILAELNDNGAPFLAISSYITHHLSPYGKKPSDDGS